MQGSKIKPHTIYAIRADEKLVRFEVKAVVTRRVNDYGNPHDYETTVEGFIVENNDRKVVTVGADRILGPYQQQAELAERERQEKAEKKRQEDEAEANRNRLFALLHEKLGVEMPDHERNHQNPFRISYHDVEIGPKGIPLLIAYLEKH